MTEKSTVRNSKISLEELLSPKESILISAVDSNVLTKNTAPSTSEEKIHTTIKTNSVVYPNSSAATKNDEKNAGQENQSAHTPTQVFDKLQTVTKENRQTVKSIDMPLEEQMMETSISYEPVKKEFSKGQKHSTTPNADLTEDTGEEDITPAVDQTKKKPANIIRNITSQTDENGKRLSFVEGTMKVLNEDERVDKAIGKVYQSAKMKVAASNPKKEEKQKKKEEKKRSKLKTGYTQDIIPVKSIINGVITTTSGKYIKILEIIPINFYNLSELEQSDVANYFGQIFNNGPVKVHLKCITDKSNPERIIQYIKNKCEEEKYQRGISDQLLSCAQDVINKIRGICDYTALTRRFFFIFQYEGSSTTPSEIIFDLESTKQSIATQFAAMGNMVVDNGIETASYDAGEILYYFFNRSTCREENFQKRIARINDDFGIYNANQSLKSKDIYDVEYLAPKGIYFTNKNYFYMDGLYKTFLMLKSKGHPSYAEPGWLENFIAIGDGTEVDVYIERRPHDITQSSLQQMNRLNRVRYKEKANNTEKQEEIGEQIDNTSIITSALANGEDLFNVCIIITLSADSIKSLRMLKTLVQKQLNRQQRFVEDSYANCKQFYMATLPLMEIPSILMNRNKRNYLTSSLKSLYMYTSDEFLDPNGFVLGENDFNQSLVSINPFNTKIFNNANISILGQTGAGKTFSMQILARAMRVCGIRVFMILPLKAHEYYRGVQAIDGSYIQFGPGMKDCYNICEIFPEQNIDRDTLSEDIHVESSLLSKKIAFLITWLKLNRANEPMDSEEADLIDTELTRMYNDFGITRDNDSIWLDKDNGILKDMPIIGDIYDRFMDIPQLKKTARCIRRYVTGNCANMNGPTNVDLSNKFICFDVDKNNMDQTLVAPFMFAAIELIYGLVKQNRLYNDMVYIDEIWNILVNTMAAEQVKDMIKIIRGYGGGVLPTTQDVNDYLENPTGKAILAGTATKIIMHLEPTEARAVAKALNLTEADISKIIHFQRGQAMLLTNNAKMTINILPSDMEIRDFTTDPALLRKYAEEEAAQKHVKEDEEHQVSYD